MKKKMLCFLLSATMMSSFVACGNSDSQKSNSNTSESANESGMADPFIESYNLLNETEKSIFDLCGPSLIEFYRSGDEYRISAGGYVAETGSGYVELISKSSGTSLEAIIFIENNAIREILSAQEVNALSAELPFGEFEALFGGGVDYPLSSDSISKLNDTLKYYFEVGDYVDDLNEQIIDEKYNW